MMTFGPPTCSEGTNISNLQEQYRKPFPRSQIIPLTEPDWLTAFSRAVIGLTAGRRWADQPPGTNDSVPVIRQSAENSAGGGKEWVSLILTQRVRRRHRRHEGWADYGRHVSCGW
jgi:hypothetical protein